MTAADQEYVQANEFVFLGDTVTEHAGLMVQVNSCIRLAINCCRKYSEEFYNAPSASLEITVRLLKAGVLEMIPF